MRTFATSAAKSVVWVVWILAGSTAWGELGPGHVVEARHGAVASVSPDASDVGVAVLKQGGNAVDAAVAVAFAMAVTWPEAGNIGGGGFMMVHPGPNKEPVCIEFRETAPAAARPDMFRIDESALSARFVGVPGTVRGLAEAHRKFGKAPWKTLVDPAVRLAEEGFTATDGLARSLNSVWKSSSRFAEFQRVFAPPEGQAAWKAGDRLVQPELAKVLRRIADDGPDSFYSGETARLIAAEMKASGGLITEADLAAYRPKIRQPVHVRFRGYDVYGPPPPSSGGVCLALMLNMLDDSKWTLDEGREPEVQLWSADDAHRMLEAMRRAYRDRAAFLGDPDFTKIPERLTSREYAQTLAATIDPMKATPSESLAGEIQLVDESEQTTHFSVVDRDGMGVSNTYTLEYSFGSRVVVRGGGFLLNNEMGDFNRVPDRTDRSGRIGTPANLAAPGKRMLSSQCPTLVLKDGQLRLAVGSPGGRTIINTVACMLVNVLAYERPLPDAVEAPRFHHAWFPDEVRFEAAARPEWSPVVEELRRRGHRLEAKNSRQGDVHAVWIDPETGLRIGVSDDRRDGQASGY